MFAASNSFMRAFSLLLIGTALLTVSGCEKSPSSSDFMAKECAKAGGKMNDRGLCEMPMTEALCKQHGGTLNAQGQCVMLN